MTITRFAPSPTGKFHVGGARTALINHMYAKENDGKFLLRIEDTDRKRYNKDSVRSITEGLDYLGVSPDDGYGVNGNSNEFVQSNRLPVYEKYINELLDRRIAYRVFVDHKNPVTEEQLSMMKTQKERKLALQLEKWRTISRIHSNKLAEAGLPYHIRLKLPHNYQGTTIKDELLGEIFFRWNTQSDQVIVKSDGFPTYHLAAMVDDIEMGVTDVIRGQEWVSSLAIHKFIYDGLEKKEPNWWHLPLILAETGKGKMSKRVGNAVFLDDLIEQGYPPEGVKNYLLSLGFGDDGKFNLKNLSVSNARWNSKKLESVCNNYIKEIPPDDLTSMVKKYYRLGTEEDWNKLKPHLEKRVSNITEAINYASPIFRKKSIDKELLFKYGHTQKELLNILGYAKNNIKNLEEKLRTYAEQNKLKSGYVFWAVRAAVLRQKDALPLFESIDIIGEKKTKQRINEVIQYVSKIS